MSLEKVKRNWQWYLMMVIANVIVLWICACPPTTKSLNGSGTNVTREELQLELYTLIETAKIRMADLDKQDELRQMIINNAILIANGTPLNPLGILSGIAALYGMGSAITYGKKKVVAKILNGKTPTTTNDSGG